MIPATPLPGTFHRELRTEYLPLADEEPQVPESWIERSFQNRVTQVRFLPGAPGRNRGETRESSPTLCLLLSPPPSLREAVSASGARRPPNLLCDHVQVVGRG